MKNLATSLFRPYDFDNGIHTAILTSLPYLQVGLLNSHFIGNPDNNETNKTQAIVFLVGFEPIPAFQPEHFAAQGYIQLAYASVHRYSQEISQQTWETLAASSWGENYSRKVGTADDNRAFGRFWSCLAPGVVGKRKAMPLVHQHISPLSRFCGCQNAEMLNSALLSDQRDLGFGFGRTKKQYFWDRIIMSLATGADPSTDGWHDSNPAVIAAGCEDWEAEATKQIMSASLHTGGRLIVSSPKYKIGWVWDFARMTGINFPEDREGFIAEQTALYFERVCKRLLGAIPSKTEDRDGNVRIEVEGEVIHEDPDFYLPAPDVHIGEYKIPGGELDRGSNPWSSHVYSTRYSPCTCGKGDWHVTSHCDGKPCAEPLCYKTDRLREVLSCRPNAWFLRGEMPS